MESNLNTTFTKGSKHFLPITNRGVPFWPKVVVPWNVGTYLKLTPKNLGTQNARLSFWVKNVTNQIKKSLISCPHLSFHLFYQKIILKLGSNWWTYCFTVLVQRVLKFLLEVLSVLPYLTWAFSWTVSHGAWCPPIINLLLLCRWSWNLQRYQAWRILHIDVKKFVTSVLLRNYDIITCILANNKSLNFRCS